MGSFTTSLFVFLLLVGFSTPQGPEEIVILTLKEVLRQQSEILQKLNDQEKKIDNQQVMIETIQTVMNSQQITMETQQPVMQEIQISMQALQINITKELNEMKLNWDLHQNLTIDSVTDSIEGYCKRGTDEIKQQDINATGSGQDGPRLVDCTGLKRMGATVSGVYEIYPVSCSQPISVWCDMDADEGGWTVFLARQLQSKPENFSRNWEDYKVGFGDPSTEYWIGNEYLHKLTEAVPTILRVDAEDFIGNQRFGKWLEFSVGNSSSKYQLKVGQFQPTISSLGDSMAKSNDQKFSTVDEDNDNKSDGTCVVGYLGSGGWWYDACSDTIPTASMQNTMWYHWNPDLGGWTKFKWLQMKIQPRESQGPVRMCHE